MHAFHGGLDFRLIDNPGIKLLSLSEFLVFVFFLKLCKKRVGFITVCFKFDSFPVMISLISK